MNAKLKELALKAGAQKRWGQTAISADVFIFTEIQLESFANAVKADVESTVVAYERYHEAHGWIPVLADDLQHYKAKGENIRKLYLHPPKDSTSIEGWQLVPIEPTDEMVKAMNDVLELAYNPANAKQMYKARHTYKAMLNAAPKPPKKST